MTGMRRRGWRGRRRRKRRDIGLAGNKAYWLITRLSARVGILFYSTDKLFLNIVDYFLLEISTLFCR